MIWVTDLLFTCIHTCFTLCGFDCFLFFLYTDLVFTSPFIYIYIYIYMYIFNLNFSQGNFLKDFIYLLLERGKGREKERERNIHVWDVASHIATNWGPGLQPRHVSWLGIRPVTFRFAGQCSVHWATPARAIYIFLERGKGRERYINWLPVGVPWLGTRNLHPRRVPRLLIEPMTLCSAGQHPDNWATPVRAHLLFLCHMIFFWLY